MKPESKAMMLVVPVLVDSRLGCSSKPHQSWHQSINSSVACETKATMLTVLLVTVITDRVTEAWARWMTDLWRFRLQFLPLPLRCVELIKLIGIFAIFHHPSKHQDPRSIADKAICRTTRWCVTLGRRNKPLICSCTHKTDKVWHVSTAENTIDTLHVCCTLSISQRIKVHFTLYHYCVNSENADTMKLVKLLIASTKSITKLT